MQRLNLRPFSTIGQYLHLLQPRYEQRFLGLVKRNLLGNILLFVPMGCFLPMLFPAVNRWWKLAGTVALTVAILEVIQLLILVGSCDVDDLILNVAGALIGYAVWALFVKLRGLCSRHRQ